MIAAQSAVAPRACADPFEQLGVATFINCAGIRAINGNTVMLPEVEQAMQATRKHFVNLDELMEAAGARIASLMGAEFAIVTSGCAAAVALGAAACIAGNDPERMLQLPAHDGRAPLVAIPTGQRFAYEQALRLAGCEVHEVGSRGELAELAAGGALALACINAMTELHSPLPFASVVAALGGTDIPILVDAAAGYPERPDPWLARGAQLICYSGGKFLRGPHATGLLAGRSDLVRAAWLNGAPHQSFGRPMKVGKGEIVGVLTAVEHWFLRHDREAMERRWYDDLSIIAGHLARSPGLASELIEPRAPLRVPRLRVRWDTTRYPIAGLGLRDRLLERPPRVMLDDIRATADSVTLDPCVFQADEAPIVARRIEQELMQARDTVAVQAAPPRPAPSAVAAGNWLVALAFLGRPGHHRLTLRQDGAAISGRHWTQSSEAAAQGSIVGNRIVFESAHRPPLQTSYVFEGTVAGDHMEGEVRLGAATQGHWGPVFRSQFGTARWRATRSGPGDGSGPP
jgi:D-glucosaminate-6-phosphate ammonia-lyase